MVDGPEVPVKGMPSCVRKTDRLPDHQALEFRHRRQVGVGRQIDLHQGSLGLPHGRDEVVGRQGPAHLEGTDIVGRHAVGLEPNAHGKGPGSQDVGPLHAGDGRQPRLHHAHQVVGDLVLLQEGQGDDAARMQYAFPGRQAGFQEVGGIAAAGCFCLALSSRI